MAKPTEPGSRVFAAMEVPEFLFHYTSQEAFLKIVESKALWATDILYMNDSAEFIYANTVAREVLQEYPADQQPALAAGFQDLNQGLSWVTEESVYVASFSELDDSLSQWRAYCPLSSGVSIAFDRVAVEKSARAQDFRLVQCVYDFETQKRMVRDIFDRALEEVGDEAVSRWCWGHLLELAPSLKHPTFAEEREWRLVSSSISLDDSRVQTRAGRSMLVPYVTVSIESDTKLTIDHLKMGPTPNPDVSWLSAHRIMRVLFKKGLIAPREAGLFPVFVHQSGVPYRSW